MSFQFELLYIDLEVQSLNPEMLVWKDTFDQNVCFENDGAWHDCSIQMNDYDLSENQKMDCDWTLSWLVSSGLLFDFPIILNQVNMSKSPVNGLLVGRGAVGNMRGGKL